MSIVRFRRSTTYRRTVGVAAAVVVATARVASAQAGNAAPVQPGFQESVVFSGLTVLVHPLTDDDLADHTTLAHWIGSPLPLDLATLDPPGVNQGVARFGKSDV